MRITTLRAKVPSWRSFGFTQDSKSANYPDVPLIASQTRPQATSRLLSLPPELLAAILLELFTTSSNSQHILLVKDGRYARAECVTDHHAAGEEENTLMQECAAFQSSLFDDEKLYSRMTSGWGDHWRCEELWRANAQDQGTSKQRSPFLAVMLACRQLYMGSRAVICSNIAFTIHDLSTLQNVLITRPLPILKSLCHLSLSIRLPIQRESKHPLTPESQSQLKTWRTCCHALDQLPNLKSCHLWLDTSDPAWRGELSSVPNGIANPFVFGQTLASVLTVDLPVNPQRPDAWKDIKELRPKFKIRARGWPGYRAEEAQSGRRRIIRLWDGAEPGTAQEPLVFGTHIVDRSPFGRLK